jgi:hypothetical protein
MTLGFRAPGWFRRANYRLRGLGRADLIQKDLTGSGSEITLLPKVLNGAVELVAGRPLHRVRSGLGDRGAITVVLNWTETLQH